jgi:uncharacterized integral membrane protein
MLKQGLIFVVVFTVVFTLMEVVFFTSTFDLRLISKGLFAGIMGYLITLLIQHKRIKKQ